MWAAGSGVKCKNMEAIGVTYLHVQKADEPLLTLPNNSPQLLSIRSVRTASLAALLPPSAAIDEMSVTPWANRTLAVPHSQTRIHTDKRHHGPSKSVKVSVGGTEGASVWAIHSEMFPKPYIGPSCSPIAFTHRETFVHSDAQTSGP